MFSFFKKKNKLLDIQKINMKNKPENVISYVENFGFINVSVMDYPEKGFDRDLSFSDNENCFVIVFKTNIEKPLSLTYKKDIEDCTETPNPIIDYDVDKLVKM